MVNKILASLLFTAFLIVGMAAAATESGSFNFSESGYDEFYKPSTGWGAGYCGSSGYNPYHTCGFRFNNIDYYTNIDVMSIELSGVNLPTGFTGAVSETVPFTAHCGGQEVGSGNLNLQWTAGSTSCELTLWFNSWDIGDLSGSQVMTLDYSIGDGDYTEILWKWESTCGNYPATVPSGNWNIMLVPFNSQYGGIAVYEVYQKYEIFSSKYWENGWACNTIIDDISNNIKITKEISGKSYTSNVTIITPLNTYAMGVGATDLDIDTVGEPIYINVIDIYGGEYLEILEGEGYCSFSGDVYDIINATPLTGAEVIAYQNEIPVGQESDTTDASGSYSYIGVPLQTPTILTTEKTGYVPMNVSFSPPWSQDWEFTLYMWPDSMTWAGNGTGQSAIGGIAYAEGGYTGVSGANVHIFNNTWSTNLTASSVGYYIAENLTANTTYFVQASAPNYTDTVNYSVVTAPNTFSQQDLALQGIYNLTVLVKNSETGMLLDNVSTQISVSDGQQESTTSGHYDFLVDWGTYTVTASAEGYYSASEYVAVDSDSTVTITLIKTSDGGLGTYYPPHNVRFHVQDEFGSPLSGLLMTAEYQESTGPIEWLQSLLGMPSDVDVENTTLSGTTGADGSITFSMIEVAQYQVTVSNATAGLSHSFLLYPKEDQYTIRFTLSDKPDMSLYPDYSVTAFDINDTHVGLNVMYNDSLTSSTDAFTFTVVTGNKTPVYSAEISDQSLNVTYAVENIKGDSYYWGFSADHAIYGEITSMQGVTLKGGTGRIVDLGLSEDNEVWYIYLSMIVTGLIAALFSVSNVKMGVIMVPLCAGFFFFIGWLPAAMAGVLAAAFAFGVLIYMRKSEYKLRGGY